MMNLLLLPLHQPGLWFVLAAAILVVTLDGWLHRR